MGTKSLSVIRKIGNQTRIANTELDVSQRQLGVSQCRTEHNSGKSARDQMRRILMILRAEIFIRVYTMCALLPRNGRHQFPGARRDVGEQGGT